MIIAVTSTAALDRFPNSRVNFGGTLDDPNWFKIKKTFLFALDAAVSAIDLQVMVTTGGRERTETEHRALLEAAAFRVTKVVPTQSEMSVVECVPV